MITAYAQNELQDENPARSDFEYAGLLLIEQVAAEFGFTVHRTCDAHFDYVNIDVDPDFENDADPTAGDLIDRFSVFLYALEDRDIGHLRFEVDTEAEKRFLEDLNLAFSSAEIRIDEDSAARRLRQDYLVSLADQQPDEH